MATFVPLAHAGHWLWVLYLPPVAVVIFSIVKSTLSERRAEREERAGGGEEKSER